MLCNLRSEILNMSTYTVKPFVEHGSKFFSNAVPDVEPVTYITDSRIQTYVHHIQIHQVI